MVFRSTKTILTPEYVFGILNTKALVLPNLQFLNKVSLYTNNSGKIICLEQIKVTNLVNFEFNFCWNNKKKTVKTQQLDFK